MVILILFVFLGFFGKRYDEIKKNLIVLVDKYLDFRDVYNVKIEFVFNFR